VGAPAAGVVHADDGSGSLTSRACSLAGARGISGRLAPVVRFLLSVALVAAVSVVGAAVRAQETSAPTDVLPEGPDPTRLDVERLPPEAIEVTRDLYAHGIFVEGWLGARTFRGGLGKVSAPGLYANIGVGLEILPWLMVRAAVEGSIHGTNAPPPPSPTVFEVIGALVELRLQANVSSRFALWLAGEGGLVYASGDILRVYGFDQSGDIGLAYGGTAGLDWHMVNRHHSIGLLGGVRLYPTLDAPGDKTSGIHGAAYLRYVF